MTEVFLKDKTLFLFFLLFIAFQAFFIYKGVETVPFFHWGMYSGKVNTGPHLYTQTEIAINDTVADLMDIKDLPAGYVQSILEYYASLTRNGFYDPIQTVIEHRSFGHSTFTRWGRSQLANSVEKQEDFREWICHYLNGFDRQHIQKIKILEQSYEWKKDHFELVGSSVIDSFRCENERHE